MGQNVPLPPTEQLTEFLSAITEQTHLSENVARVAEAMVRVEGVLGILRSVTMSMIDDRHKTLIPMIKEVSTGLERFRDETQTAITGLSDEVHEHQQKIDRCLEQMRQRVHSQEMAAIRVKQDNVTKDQAAADGLTFHWTQKVPAKTIGKVIAWIVSAALTGLGGGELLKRFQAVNPSSISAPASPRPPARPMLPPAVSP